MRRYGLLPVWFAALVASVALSGCSTPQTAMLLKDLQGCERHYNGVASAGMLGGANFSGSIQIDCVPKGARATTHTVTTAVAPATPLTPGSVEAPVR